MAILPYVIVSVVLFAAVFLALRAIIGAHGKYGGGGVVVCPETKEAAGVEVDTTHAAWSSLSGTPGLRLKNCSRWPERQDCGRPCLSQIQESPENCMIRHLLSAWYAGKSCAYCNRDLSCADWTDHKPCVQLPNGRTTEWSEIAYEQVPTLLSSGRPVCWNCHITESFRASHPELIIDRHRSAGRSA